MDYLIAFVACLWATPFLIKEHRAPTQARWPRTAWRLVGSVPIVVLSVLTVVDRFSPAALMIVVVFILATGALGFLGDIRKRTRDGGSPGSHPHGVTPR